ncbi:MULTISPECIES: ATP-dependent Clp protease adaptor ClpS [Bacteroidota]|jgi:ATP-dependent Clp protease adaptor protein ClpS|uniref:ATP-dependent Clp protease adaptor ClpS n=3 Tax=Flectobacillus TaxID=101 RepID=A0ABT6Z4J0_9BACT|nr:MULTISPECIES: ATP-dependent Clp protease adaptor ClpS [Bacteroidota]NBA75955.1 ATP-dependent Clp protease adaptor ClpS [Emticicia sp. ODNR4P]MDI9858469.1 ATP-dependent Clp protease adaptor ClpS [Flectobacillus roseus]MDI9863166.1 ATP-dependent Clp protease adaptor ClpS [Flectobacillus longus]MDI9870401.1 ATP-dependent Clp protease adaptor ClpS [Flectobacillus roseus]MDI9876034.1 ATP-dependent Clp protease adaptor ClpS [Flectobacillus rivi]
MRPFEQFEEEVDVLEDVKDTDQYDLVVFNDDVNTFDYVIETLIDVCGHTPEQAEQCTILIHFKGKCSVKKGSFDELAPMRNDICRRGLSAEVM